MLFNSLLWLEDSKKQKINPQVIKDLGLDTVYNKLIAMSEENEALVYELCLDEETIVYRQNLLSDFTNDPELLKDLVRNLEGFAQLKPRMAQFKANTTTFYSLIHLVILLEASVKCLETLHQTLHYHQFSSSGMLQLRELVSNMVEATAFLQMKKDLKEIRFILREIKSVEMSVNMTPGLRPTDVQVTDVNEYSYRFPKAFRKVSDALEQNKEFFGKYMKSYEPIFGLGIMDWDIMDELEHAFRKHKTSLRNFVNTYERTDIAPFLTLLKELTFYSASYDLMNALRLLNCPLCPPKLLKTEARTFQVKDFYNVHTAFDIEGEGLVYNDLTMDEEARILILTGANMGGKTTVTQAIGQIQLFTQLGLWVSAREATLSLVDNIFTHFPVLEKETLDLGRLGKECQMFSELFHQTTPFSMILLNEPFTGTSYLESLKIAEEAVRAVKHRRARMLVNTHLHELAQTTRGYNETLENDTTIVSIVVGREQDCASFKIAPGEPLGKSYAQDIARKYGVTFEQLTKRLGGEGL
ncbi:MAG: hypothetical protein H7X94_09370 [Vallitaleaceae bacterium]|nr:hypothetical protein [Vallitaleaceae bacterium]